MSRRHSIIGPTPDAGPRKGMEKRRMSIADISLAKKKVTKSADSRRSSAAPPARRASVAAIAVSVSRRASFGGVSISDSRRASVPNFSSDLQGIIEGEHFVDESELFDIARTGSGKNSKKSRKRSDAALGDQEEKEKVVEPSAEEKKEVFRCFLNETLKSVFDLIMVNDNININIDNVFPLMKTLELDTKDEAILDMVRTSCIETFGDIDEVEFDNAVVDLRKRTVGDEFEDDMRSAFNLIDYDEDGFITTSDIYQLMMGLGEMLTDYELDDLLKASDKDRDGKISYKDFKLFLVGEWTDEDELRENGADNVEEEEDKKEESSEKQTAVEGGKSINEDGTPVPVAKDGNEEDKQDGNDEVKETGEIQEEGNVVEVVKPPPKPRNSLFWGYMNKEDEEQNNAIADYVKQLEAKDKKNETVLEEANETEKNVNGDVVKETNDDAENDSEETKVKVTEDGEPPDPPENGKDESKPFIDHIDINGENETESNIKHSDDVDSLNIDNIDSKPPGDDDIDGTEDARSVISVTVKHLDSIMEEGEDDHEQGHVSVSRPQSIRKSQLIRQSSSASLRIRPQSGLTESSIDVFGDDSGIDFIDGDDFKNEEVFDNFDDEGVYSRESSAKDRVASEKSRGYHSQNSHTCQSIEETPRDGIWEEEVTSGGQRSVSTQLNFNASDPDLKDMFKTKSHRLHLCTEKNGSIGPFCRKKESDSSYDIDSDVSANKINAKEYYDQKAPDHSLKRLHVQNLVVDHVYCEAGVEEVDSDRMEVGSIIDYCSSVSSPRPSSRVYTRQTPNVPITKPYRRLLRTTSADRFKTIKQLENRILRHQNTDPQFSKHSMMKANDRVNGLGRSNPNGLKCSHIDLDLGLGDELDVGQNFRPYSPMRRPRTAMTFKEARRRGINKSMREDYSKYDSGIDSPDTDDDKGVSVVDLSQRLKTQFGEIEASNQPLQHHGYKSVWPLARVMTAYNNKYNDGKSMQLNSISRRLERREIPECWGERENPDIKFRERPQTAREPLNVRVNQRPQTARVKSSAGGRQRPMTTGRNIRARPQTAESVRVSRTCAQPAMLNHSSAKQSNGGIITLALPFQTDSKTRYKRMSHLSNYGTKYT
ncbi:uncharacterized protein LOC110466178 [Mizuhopecten yessoensis]|uniref:Calmodulin-like protein 6 n=1 Tax=Mizuhopecten yessoensis TaxID=6573 RepID=A0A210PPX4_MIZYE|nr:uncharacterized protein LOC110466178 [Mizuhopecten yessoensis]OWF38522.1 calmodulin-like protein 6 [Mizuhopecten yessoensis]